MEPIETLQQEAQAKIQSAASLSELNELRVLYLGKKGPVQELMKGMKDLPKEEKPIFGQKVNQLKQLLSSMIEDKKVELEKKEMEAKIENEEIDITLPGRSPVLGNAHPLNLVKQELEDLFIGLGYQVIEGNDIVDDLYCFERANIPKDHPARDMQDSLYIDQNTLLGTHTTAIQMMVLEKSAPNLPIKVVCPGKVYRRDDDDATHSHQFMQMEGLVIGEKVTLSDLKGTLEFMAKKLFGQDRQIRFRPSYFPFTEPSVEVDVSCHICNEKG